MTAEQLEELRLLTNAEMDSRMPFCGILLGQPSIVDESSAHAAVAEVMGE